MQGSRHREIQICCREGWSRRRRSCYRRPDRLRLGTRHRRVGRKSWRRRRNRKRLPGRSCRSRKELGDARGGSRRCGPWGRRRSHGLGCHCPRQRLWGNGSWHWRKRLATKTAELGAGRKRLVTFLALHLRPLRSIRSRQRSGRRAQRLSATCAGCRVCEVSAAAVRAGDIAHGSFVVWFARHISAPEYQGWTSLISSHTGSVLLRNSSGGCFAVVPPGGNRPFYVYFFLRSPTGQLETDTDSMLRGPTAAGRRFQPAETVLSGVESFQRIS